MKNLFTAILISSLLTLLLDVNAQSCVGDACGAVRQTANLRNGFTYTNTSNRSVKVGIRPAVNGFGGGGGNMTYTNLGPGQSTNIGGAYTGPYEATFTSSAPQPPAPQVNYATPKLQNGNYRIKNASTNGYLHLVRGELHLQPNYYFLTCDMDVTSETEDAKWIISVKNRAVTGTNTEETYQIQSKAAPLSYLQWDFDDIINHPSHRITITGPIPPDWLQWEIVTVPGTDHFRFKGRGEQTVIILSPIHDKVNDFSDPLGNPLSSQWVLERCN
jgi:hypothetical protein